MKILFTCVGKRVELLQAFKAASENLGVSLQIIGTDITDTAPALFFCDKRYIVCKIWEPEYIHQLLSICIDNQIDALIPTIDTDLLILSQHKAEFAQVGTRVIVSDEEKIRICRDKRITADYLQSIGLKSPHPVDDYTKYTAGYPAFIKPKDGSSSIYAYKVDNASELKAYAEQVPDYIIQPFIDGTEYTVDVFCDLDGNPIYITPRIRIAVRAGEVLKTKLCQDKQIEDEIRTLISAYRPCGAITVQLIRQKDTSDDYYIEINPRFGGGVPLSMKAGADSATAMLRLLNGETIRFISDRICFDSLYSRFDQSVCVRGNNQVIKAVIFDLDDTLYAEKDYVRSGYAAIANVLPQVNGTQEKLWIAFCENKPAIDTVLQEAGIVSQGMKDFCLQTYHSHMPNITLYHGVATLLATLRGRNVKIGILTDGCPEGQRNKIKALQLADKVDEIIVTDEIGGVTFRKPNDISFRIMQRKLQIPFANMLYVGDNPTKDFFAPQQLGMQTIWLKNNDGIYAANYPAALPYIKTVCDWESLKAAILDNCIF